MVLERSCSQCRLASLNPLRDRSKSKYANSPVKVLMLWGSFRMILTCPGSGLCINAWLTSNDLILHPFSEAIDSTICRISQDGVGLENPSSLAELLLRKSFATTLARTRSLVLKAVTHRAGITRNPTLDFFASSTSCPDTTRPTQHFVMLRISSLMPSTVKAGSSGIRVVSSTASVGCHKSTSLLHNFILSDFTSFPWNLIDDKHSSNIKGEVAGDL